MNKLLVFSASWCGPCKQMAPAVDELAQEYPGQVFKYDADVEVELRTRYKVQAVPTLVIVDEHGEEVRRTLGAMPKHALEKFLLNE